MLLASKNYWPFCTPILHLCPIPLIPRTKRKYPLQNLLENLTLKLVILSLLCIGDLLIWRFNYLEICPFLPFMETAETCLSKLALSKLARQDSTNYVKTRLFRVYRHHLQKLSRLAHHSPLKTLPSRLARQD